MPLNDSRLKSIQIIVFSGPSEQQSIMETLQNLSDVILKNSGDIMSSKSDQSCYWESIVSQFQNRYSDVSSLEKRISLLEAELDSQSLLVVQAV
jgi:hypothetical protein